MSLTFRTSYLAALCLTLTETVCPPVALPQEKLSPPVIRLERPVAEKTTAALSRRLGELLGVEVRLPKRTPRQAVIEAGEWTAAQLLTRVGKDLGGAGWELRYELTASPIGGVKSTTASKLPPGGKVTLSVIGVGIERAVRLIEQEAACVIELPESVPVGRYRLEWRETPLERALAELARAAGLIVRTVVVFEMPEEAQARHARADESRLTRESQQQAHIALRLEELYGSDPTSDEFPWDAIDRDAVARSLSQEMDLDLATVEGLMERVRTDGAKAQTGD